MDYGNTEVSSRTGNGYAKIEYDTYSTTESSSLSIKIKDKAAPNKPSNGELIKEGNVVKWKDNGDNGSTYYHMVESFNSDNGSKLHTSNITEDYVISGVKGWYYYIDNKENGTVTKQNSKFTEVNYTDIERSIEKQYIHIATVDGAGNLSGTYHFEILPISNYTVNHYLMNTDGETYDLQDSDIITEVIGTNIVAETHNYEGFLSPEKKSGVVLPDNELVIDYYYTRIKSTLQVDPAEGYWEDSTEIKNFTHYYNTIKDIPIPNRVGYVFAGWERTNHYGSLSSEVSDANYTYGSTNNVTDIIKATWKLITHDITGTITWNDQENNYTSRPSEVEVTLNSDEEITEEGALQTPATKGITSKEYGFENLQTKKIASNTDYEYTVSQNKVPGYETLVNGYDIINNLILPSYTSKVTTTPLDNTESEWIKNESVQIVGVVQASNENRDKVGVGKEEVNFQIDSGIQIDQDSIKITYMDEEGNQKEITSYIIEDNKIKVTFESNRVSDRTAGDSLQIELKGKIMELKEYTNTISYQGYLRDYETGEDTNINLGMLTTAEEVMAVGKVSIAIEEINEENEITVGSHFEIRKRETGEVVQSFITAGRKEAIRKLEPMVEYVVIETQPTPGYTTAEEATFILNENGEIEIKEGAEKEENTIKIRDYKTRLQVEIREEITNEYITGPTWQIIRKIEKDGQMVEEIVTEWTSEGKEVQVEKLPIGPYTLREVSIGEDTGYVTIGDTEFYIEDTKELQVLEIEQKVSRVKIHLKDIETEEYIEGAVLQIIKKIEENGKMEEKIIREWTTREEGELQLKLPVGEYTIRKVKLPENSGYVTIEETPMKVIDTLKEQPVELKQGFTKIRIEVVDEETKEKIEHLEIEIIEKKTGKVVKLKETEEGYIAERLPIGDYIVREKTPEGYKEVEEIEINIKDTEKEQITKMENKRLIYDMQVEKELISITIEGEKKIVPREEMQKIEVKTSKINTADIRLEYVIRVSNKGETKATIGEIIDNIPEGFQLLSTDWKQEGRQAIWNGEKEELEIGQSKEVRIVLKWENNVFNFGAKKNTANLKGSTNPYGYEDKNTENDIGEETVIFSIKTGISETTIVVMVIVLLSSIVISLLVGLEIVVLKRNRKC